jgi:hypothetical protein
LELQDRSEIEFNVGRIFADSDCPLVYQTVRRHRQIVGRRHALEDASGEIVLGSMAWPEVAAEPVGLGSLAFG